jgi:hypothetical protein
MEAVLVVLSVNCGLEGVLIELIVGMGSNPCNPFIFIYFLFCQGNSEQSTYIITHHAGL